MISEASNSPQPRALAPAELAMLLSKASGLTFTAEDIAEDIASGAPVDAYGKLELISYIAWLAGEEQRATT